MEADADGHSFGEAQIIVSRIGLVGFLDIVCHERQDLDEKHVSRFENVDCESAFGKFEKSYMRPKRRIA